MKVGIFIGGQMREDVETLKINLELLQTGFDTDNFAFAVWDDDAEAYSDFLRTLGNVEVFDRFDIDYEPYIENPKAVLDYQYQKKLDSPNPRHKHQTKQILLHNELMKKYGKNFDVIVRSRWDGTISPAIDFLDYIRETVETPCTMNICTRDDYHRSIITIGERASWDHSFLHHRSDETEKVYYLECGETKMFLDSGILIHRSQDWNSELVERLHNTKKLLAAEFGWWQVLVDGTKHKQWVHYDGGATITRCVTKSEMKDIKKMLL